MSKVSRGFAAFGLLAVLALGLSPAKAAPAGNLPLSLCSRDHFFSPTPGSAANPYFPLTPALTGVLVGPDDDEIHGLALSLGGTRSFYDGEVVTRIVREFEWRDDNSDGDQDTGEPSIEDSDNYFAQTEAGTVCYFGEVVKHFDENGDLIPGDDTGSWLAGEAPPSDCPDRTPNAPGIIMPANPKPGMQYQQEVAPCVALDYAQVVGVGTVRLRNGTSFSNAIRTKEGNLLEKGKGYKAYAQGEGLIIDAGLHLCTTSCGSSAASRRR